MHCQTARGGATSVVGQSRPVPCVLSRLPYEESLPMLTTPWLLTPWCHRPNRVFRAAGAALLLVGAVGCVRAGPSAGGRAVVNPPGIAPLVPAYSVAIRSGTQVYVSGMTGIAPGTQDIVAGGVAAQTRQTLENIRTAVQAAGATMGDVNECTVFLVDMADYAAMNTVYVEFFRVDPPARATLAVSALPRPAARVEIKCSADLRRR